MWKHQGDDLAACQRQWTALRDDLFLPIQGSIRSSAVSYSFFLKKSYQEADKAPDVQAKAFPGGILAVDT